MTITGNHINNNALAALSQQASPRIVNAIQTASTRTGVDFAYLLEKAAAESSFDASAKASTSSATGLYQFIESTWLQMVKDHGAKYGLGHYADQIDHRGRVTDAEARKEILELRKNPEKAALLAAEFAAGNQQHLERHTNLTRSEIGSTELYLAHFMGASGASGFINAMQENPLATAADIFPKAARANRNVFYDRKTGEARTLAGVYEFFDRKFTDSPQMPAANKVAVKPAVPRSKPDPARMLLQDMLAQEINNDRAILTFLSDSRSEMRRGWRPSALVPQGRPIMDPAQLLVMAQMELPERERTPRYND